MYIRVISLNFDTMKVMKADKKKDALTDVVDISTAPQSNDPKVGDGQTVATNGEIVTLGMDKEVDSVARKLIKIFSSKKQ